MFEITNFRVKNIESFPSLKAEFTAKFKMLELNRFRLMQNNNGELYVAEPTDKPYENREGKKIYPKFYFLSLGLKNQIAEKAIEALHAQDVKTAQDVMNEPIFDPSDEVPF